MFAHSQLHTKDKTLSRALDSRTNGAWLSKLMKHELVILGGQTIDQKLRV